jgi:hypothetical protein
MGEKPLVESQIDDSIRLILKLDLDGNSPTLAVWYFYDDLDEWRLLIAGPTFDALLPKQEPVAYGKLVEAMASVSLSYLSISYLKLVRTNSPLAQALHFLIRTGSTGTARTYFSNTTLNGIFIKDMVILRST